MTRSALALALAALLMAPAAAAAQVAPGDSVAGVITSVPSPGSPQDSALDARTKALATELRCPVCQGLSLQDSPSELAQQMRAVIRDQLRAGKSPAQVRDYFVSKYGEWILMQPEAHGFNLLVYLLPVLGVLGGGAVILLAARRWMRTPVAEAQQPRADTPLGRS